MYRNETMNSSGIVPCIIGEVLSGHVPIEYRCMYEGGEEEEGVNDKCIVECKEECIEHVSHSRSPIPINPTAQRSTL